MRCSRASLCRSLLGSHTTLPHTPRALATREGQLSGERGAGNATSLRGFIRQCINWTVVPFLVGGYFATWSAVLWQTIIFPSHGSGQASVSAAHAHSKQKADVSLVQRRHKPPGKSISLLGYLAPTARFPHEPPRAFRTQKPSATPALLDPFLPSHSSRAPPLSQTSSTII